MVVPPPLSVLHGLENRVDGLRREVLVVNVVDHQHRRAAASREALLLDLQVELAVRSALPRLDAESLLDVSQDVVAAAQHARDVRAHRDAVPADGLRLEHRVERSDLEHLNVRQLQIVGDGHHELGRQKAAVLVLRRVQRGNHGATLSPFRELRDPVVDFLADMGRQRAGRSGVLAHRSISPKTMSWVPITATTSASMWPTTISFKAARCGKPGARTFSRYGLFEPSETM